MSDQAQEIKTEVTKTDSQVVAEQPKSEEAPQQKTYTESELNAMMAARLSKQERALKKAWEDEQAEAKRQAELTLEEKAKEAEARAKQALADADAKILRAERKADLAGKVSNPDRVLLLIGDKSEDYFEGSTPNIEKILADFPEYAPSQPTKTATDISSGQGKSLSLADVKKMTPEQINANWEAVQAVLSQQ